MSVSIPFGKLEEGVQKSLENAARYFEDAVLLFHNGRYLSSILLSMHSFEESAKALLLMNYRSNDKAITKSQWHKKFSSHVVKNPVPLKTILPNSDDTPESSEIRISVSRLSVKWKNIFSYTDYDFEKLKWTSPTDTKSIGISDVKSHSSANIVRAGKALKAAMEKAMRIERVREALSQVDESFKMAIKIVREGIDF